MGIQNNLSLTIFFSAAWLLILAMIDKNMGKIKRAFLLIVFGVSLAVSHYGTSYIYMFCLISAWLILVSGENPGIQKLINNLSSKFGKKRGEFAINVNPLSAKNRTISSTFVLIFITFTLAWETVSLLHSVTKYLHLLSQFFILVGVLTLLFKRGDTKFERGYKAFSLVFSVICFAGIGVPYFASSLNTSRLYQITLVFLAPFCVIGGITVLKVVSRIVKVSWTDQRVKSSLRALSTFFAIFLLFNSGWVYEVAKDHPPPLLNNTIDYPRFNHQEVSGAEWITNVKGSDPIYADGYRWLLLGGLEWGQARNLPKDIRKVKTKYIKLTDVIGKRSKIYDNGGAQVYHQ